MAVNLLSDRELLELAAKASDLDHLKWSGFDLRDMDSLESPSDGWGWNPLEYDAQALKLLADLRLSICVKHDSYHNHYVSVNQIGGSFFDTHIEWFDKHDSDLHAIRRAIVCAAASIGRSKP